MAKNIVVCCDGTANEFARDRTNVVKLFYTLWHDPTQQVAYYHPGLGTMEPPGTLTTAARTITKLLGRAFGYGLPADINDAYVFLMNHYEEGDHVYLFGFSRGAYTVRAVASMLKMYGLIRKGNEPLVPYAIRMLSTIDKLQDRKAGTAQASRAGNVFRLAAQFTKTFSSVTCKPHFVGLWDTVSSVGWVENPLRVPFTANNPDIEIGRHAISIDERRAFFRTNLWMPKVGKAQSGPKDLQQVWFPGVHSDVGGGYPEEESGLSKIALEWMIHEACAAGLLVDEERVSAILGGPQSDYVAPNPKAQMHESLKGLWCLAEFLPKKHYDWRKATWRRRMNLFRRRTIPPQSLIHESALQRGDDYKTRLPADAIFVSTSAARQLTEQPSSGR